MRPTMRLLTTLALGGLATGVLPAAAYAVDPAVSPPSPSLTLPAELDDAASYEAQTTCDPVLRPGLASLRSLVLATYGGGDSGTLRGCGNGVTEHSDGRAWDWTISAADPEQKARADAFLAWLTAPSADGRPAEMARRLGVMYVIWDKAIWSVYRSGDGWRPYSGSDGHTAHVHISMSWDGAMARTSWYTGHAVRRDLCSSWGSSVPGSVVVPLPVTGTIFSLAPTTLTDGGACRTGQSSATALKVGQQLAARGAQAPAGQVPIAAILSITSTDPSAPIGRVLVAPTGVKNASFTMAPTASAPRVVVPLGAGGSVSVATAAGSAAVTVRLIGWVAGPASALPSTATPPAAPPAAPSVRTPAKAPASRSTYRAVTPYVTASVLSEAHASTSIAVSGLATTAASVRLRLDVISPTRGTIAFGKVRVIGRVYYVTVPLRAGVAAVPNPSDSTARVTATVTGWS